MATNWQRDWQTATLLRDLDRQLVPTGTDVDPSSRWWRVRQAMRAYIEDASIQGGDRARRVALRSLGLLPGVWNERQYDQRIDTVRDLAIDMWREDEICLGGMNEFFEHFGIDEYEPDVCGVDGYQCENDDCETCFPTKEVEVTVKISFKVKNSADVYDTQRDVERYLEMEVGGNVDDIDYDTVTTEVTNVEVETLY